MDAPPRALISVYDKAGVVGLAAGLVELGWDLIASGGTARVIEAAGLPVADTADYTGSPTMLRHRVVTLHPRIHGGILADRDDPAHRADLEANGIDPIDLVVVNLYPFEASPGIETIDIGGPTMVRAAAKNHAHVGVVVDPADYEPVLDELRSAGRLSATTRRQLARKAFAHTASYEDAIAGWFDAGDQSDEIGLPSAIRLELERAETLRYGENPHQHGARYRARGNIRVLRRRRPARRPGFELPQPDGRRVGLAASPQPGRRSGRSDRQARQPVRSSGRWRSGHRLLAGS